jgi:hypothetical protein
MTNHSLENAFDATQVSKATRRRWLAAAAGALCIGLSGGCVPRPLVGQTCPCALGLTCDETTNVCYRGDAGADGAGTGGSADSQVAPHLADGSADAPAIVTIGPSYVCGPADAGVKCYCGTQPFFPAPVDDMGQQQTFVLPPDPTAVMTYQTVAQFDAVAVGRWRRTAGEGELVCEQFGVDFTADHRMVPLVVATDGTVEEVNALAIPFVITFGSLGPVLGENGSTASNIAPVFFDAGQSMYLNVAPWPGDYARVP